MASRLVTALVVSGLGMLMLFVAMLLLYGLMYGMTVLIKDRPPARGQGVRTTGDGDSRVAMAGKREAAVVATALARAEEEMSEVGAQKATEETVSAWWMLHHHRQLTRDRRSRGLG